MSFLDKKRRISKNVDCYSRVILTQKVKFRFFWASYLRDFEQKIIKVGIISTFSKEIMKIIKNNMIKK